ncbi:uncharacterized protein DSM5745_09824 [Aspergillus mulundensis]|uniref:Cobalamin-independent methionine synthase MetE C-terminal/archaeal domain-containing protein n=1 Tax=Aspergillus mulundensis TaxID=1810919 RepID=A0A3D8QRG8_9EURO|nr:Uncharacterized protein DSM5745_09824 [Aspergillus mulundensis]RDW64413.1 Uncharacterized protein DSM5745_09824 [Aspergillus mulundensis]
MQTQTPNPDPIGVLLIGSIPLPSPDAVFAKLATTLPNRLHTLPDGETSTRYNWIEWQLPCFPLETLRPQHGGIDLPATPGVYSQDSIGRTRYDEVAIESYTRFVALRENGIIPAGVRFQVSLPTPYAVIQSHLRPEFHAQFEPWYEARLLEALAAIIAHVPASALAIQWDVAVEVLALEHERGRLCNEFFRPHFINEPGGVRAGVLSRIGRICAGIPADVELGFHFCYGDAGHRHFVEPEDLGLVVDLANGVVEMLGKMRDIGWVHVPVPKGRDDEAYFEPLRGLRIAEETRLYLGLVHAYDLDGTRWRIRAAQRVLQRGFGVATECGIGRTPGEELESILDISMEVTAPIRNQ